jgi:acyl-CoA synthetase (AMP-forming)/AMP-acid ligase II
MLGYYRAPDLTAKVIDSEGWFNTGDLARFEGDCLYIVGRSKKMINLYPAMVEALLNSHNDVQSAVVGRALNSNDELVVFVQLFRGSRVKPTDLMDFISPKLTSYHRPPKIIVVDTCPATSFGKVIERDFAGSRHSEGNGAATRATQLQRRTHLT